MRLRVLWTVMAILLWWTKPAAWGAEESPRVEVINAMILRPDDPWPRGKGHVVFGMPGATEELKAYHEPGGNFSPAFGSFGLSIWVLDGEGKRLESSDSVPMDEIEQGFFWPMQRIWPRRPEVPGIKTVTPDYETEWSVLGESRWQLRARPTGTNALAVVLRSVGPAGAELQTLHWFDDNRLYVNDRWVVSFNLRPQQVEIVPPGGPARRDGNRAEASWTNEVEWGYAKFVLLPQQEQWLTIEDAVIPPVNPFKPVPARLQVAIQVPDQEFLKCLEAQVAHLLMGVVGVETRPGDPNNYPLNWLRDGAYGIVALARAGRLDAASQLARPFAENDFFGGFGSEADAPGLALWALTEVAGMQRDRRFDEWLWPHARRKAELIVEMLSATNAVRKPYVGPIVPQYEGHEDLDLVCEAAKDGLITGRMDWHRPILYVNAVSHRGLLNAAELAAGLGMAREAERWREHAVKLREAWMSALTKLEPNERTMICGLYPSWIVTERDAYGTLLRERRQSTHGPDDLLMEKPRWTYFTLAEAHQWLMLGRADHVWNDLRWFWANQASPGLYTWWEGDGEENNFGRWETVRGWATPLHVTPHYWAAAEMMLLQLDMLTCLDESGAEPVLRIGQGLPAEWLGKPMSAKGVPTRLGKVDWEWADGRMTVRARGFRGPVELGPVFPPETELRVRR